MVLIANNDAQKKWDKLYSQQGDISQLDILCLTCGGYHLTQDHWKFMAERMPKDPLEMIDDLIKMRVYKQDSLALAQTISAADLRKELFFKTVGRSNPERERLARELASLAGGLDQAFAAAFGHRSAEFFSDAHRVSNASRRRFCGMWRSVQP
jgi:nitrate/nitrite transport system substrate-binding protein